MKLQVFVLLMIIASSGCGKKEKQKVYLSRSMSATEDFNQFGQENAQLLKTYTANDEVLQPDAEVPASGAIVKFGDTAVVIQVDSADRNSFRDKFSFVAFLNSHKTAMLVQVADKSGLTAPFFILSVKQGKLDVVRLFRASNGQGDKRFTKGLTAVGRSGYLVNNDFLITRVDAKVYPIPRQHPDERIQGLYFINSPDRKTLVFLVSSSLYQVNYPTGRVFTQPLSANVPKNPKDIFAWIQENYAWVTDKEGVSLDRKSVV